MVGTWLPSRRWIWEGSITATGNRGQFAVWITLNDLLSSWSCNFGAYLTESSFMLSPQWKPWPCGWSSYRQKALCIVATLPCSWSRHQQKALCICCNLGPVAEAVTDRKPCASTITASNSLLRTWVFGVDNSGSLCLILWTFHQVTFVITDLALHSSASKS